MAAKIILITGANTGLGLETVKALYKSSTLYNILIGCRTVRKGEDAAASVKKEFPDSSSTIGVVEVDIGSDTSIQKAFDQVSSQHGKLDVLINNAGANFDNDIYSGKSTIREAWNQSWDTNVAGTQVMTTTFIPLLLKSTDPRLLFIASGTSSITETEKTGIPALDAINKAPDAGWPKDPGPNPIAAYRSSKAGLNMLMRDWTRVLKNDGVKVWAVSPGFLATGLAGHSKEKLKKMGAREPSEGGEFIRDVVQGQRDHLQGKVIRKGAVQDW